jgi:hypothetical protein
MISKRDKWRAIGIDFLGGIIEFIERLGFVFCSIKHILTVLEESHSPEKAFLL